MNVFYYACSYAFLMDLEGLEKNNFMKTGEYVEFDTEVPVVIDKEYCRVLPGGEYACCMVHVVKRNVDFSVINAWLKNRHKTGTYFS